MKKFFEMSLEKKSQSFSKIVSATKPIIFSAIRKYLWLENIDLIDDIAQEVYYKAYRSLLKNQFKFNSKIETWLYTITKNECLKTNRKNLIEKIQFNEEEVNQQQVEQVKNISEKKNITKEEKIFLSEIVNSLPEKYKKIIDLVIEGYREKEIAKIVNIAVGTVKSRKNKALTKLSLIAQRSSYELE